MKLKEFGLGGGGSTHPKFYYVDPPLVLTETLGNMFCTPNKSQDHEHFCIDFSLSQNTFFLLGRQGKDIFYYVLSFTILTLE